MRFLFAGIFGLMSWTVFGQQDKALVEKSPVFLGICPRIEIEVGSTVTTILNIVPAAFQKPISTKCDIRFTTRLDLLFSDKLTEFTDFGAEIAMPWFPAKVRKVTDRSNGVYFAPALGSIRDIGQRKTDLRLLVEVGYLQPLGRRFSLSIGTQVGAIYSMYDYDVRNWKPHFGVKLVMGWWRDPKSEWEE